MGSTSHRRTPFVIVLLLLAALAVSLVAGLTSTAAEETASPAAGDEKVIYRVGWPDEPDSMNPYIGYTAEAFEIWYLNYDALIGFDAATLSPMKGEESTGLATDWTTSEDGLVWTFTLRQDAVFSDGEPLTAEDVAFSYNYVIENDLENWTAYTNLIDEAVVIDDYTVEFRCSKPKPDMIRHWVPILPEHIWGEMSPKEAGKNFQNPPPIVGSGPFKCMEWKKNGYIKMVKNPTWWGAEPKIDEIYFMYFTNADTMVQDLKSGNIDGIVDLNASQMGLFENNPEIEARAIAIDGFNELGFNCYDGPSGAHPALRDWKFRQALNWAVDLQKVVDLVWLGYTTPGTTIVPPDYYTDPDWHWEPPDDVKYSYDPAMAAQKLEEAGYPLDADGRRTYKGEPIELSLIARSESAESQQIGKLVVGWFRDVGVKVNMEVMDEGALMDRQYEYTGDKFTPNYDMFLWGWYLDFDPGSMLNYFTAEQIENWSDCNWTDPEYEELYNLQAEELDTAKRVEYVHRMQEILYEQTPYIVTDYSPDFEAFNTAKWDGYIFIPDPRGNALVPPFGNGGYANFLSIGPKTATTTDAGGTSTTTIVVIVAAVAAVAIAAVLLLRRRPKSTMEE